MYAKRDPRGALASLHVMPADQRGQIGRMIVGTWAGRDPEAALGQFASAVEVMQRAYPRGHPMMADLAQGEATCLARLGRVEAALRRIDTAFVDLKRFYPPGASQFQALHIIRAQVLHQAGREASEVEADLRQAVAIESSAKSPDAVMLAWSLNDLGNLQRELGQVEAARETLRQADARFRLAAPAGQVEKTRPDRRLP